MTEFDVLLVDDEDRFLHTMGRLLTRLGYSLCTANGGPEALEMMSRHDIQVVVLDVRMPGMDGLQVLKTIKQKYPLAEVIMLTGHATVDAAVDGLKSGAADYIMKPVDIETLTLKIDQSLEKRSLKKEKIAALQRQ